MAPCSTEPRQILVVLNPARRKALYQLVTEITTYMQAQFDTKTDDDDDDDDDDDGQNLDNGWSPDQHRAEAAPGDVTANNARSPAQSGHAEDNILISQSPTSANSDLAEVRKAAVSQFHEWRKDFLVKLKEILAKPDDAEVLESRQKRKEKMAQVKADTPAQGEDLMKFDNDDKPGTNTTIHPSADADAVKALQAIYHPVPTRLTTVPIEDRKEVLSAVLILLLSTGHYSAYSRTFVTYLTSAFGLPLSFSNDEEAQIAKTMIEATNEAEKAKQNGQMSAEAEAEKRKQENKTSRFWKVGLASVAGAALIGVTGGLAAPVVAGAIGGLMGSVGLGGLASFLGIFWMNGALVGTLFGAFGARMTGEIVDKYAKEVEDFRFLPLQDEWGPGFSKDDSAVRRLRVTIGINGWLMSEDEVTKPWRILGNETEAFALRYEVESLLKLGSALEDMVSSCAWSVLKIEILRRTVLATLWAALWPIQILKLAAGVDNPFNLAKNRSEKAGKILADALINKVQGERPVTLIGYSLGARVVYFCLKTLAERKAFGLVDTVVFIGAPVPSNRKHWQVMRSVVSGKLFNVYSEQDWILAFLYRATSIQLGVAGLQAVTNIDGVENLDLSHEVKGHLRYPELIPQILTKCGFPGIDGGEDPIEEEEEIRLEDRNGNLLNLEPQPEPEPEPEVVTPVKIKPLAKKVHREVSFPSGITGKEERPVMRKVQSVPVSGVSGRHRLRSSSLDSEELDEPRTIELVIRDNEHEGTTEPHIGQ